MKANSYFQFLYCLTSIVVRHLGDEPEARDVIL